MTTNGAWMRKRVDGKWGGPVWVDEGDVAERLQQGWRQTKGPMEFPAASAAGEPETETEEADNHGL